MTEPSRTTLLPCPFCGSRDVAMVKGTKVCCYGCQAVVHFVTSSTDAYSRQKWNSRSFVWLMDGITNA